MAHIELPLHMILRGIDKVPDSVWHKIPGFKPDKTESSRKSRDSEPRRRHSVDSHERQTRSRHSRPSTQRDISPPQSNEEATRSSYDRRGRRMTRGSVDIKDNVKREVTKTERRSTAKSDAHGETSNVAGPHPPPYQHVQAHSSQAGQYLGPLPQPYDPYALQGRGYPPPASTGAYTPSFNGHQAQTLRTMSASQPPPGLTTAASLVCVNESSSFIN
jgi:hypothetical protein